MEPAQSSVDSNAAAAPLPAVTALQLCQISYDDPADILGEIARLPPLNGVPWRCAWGPAVDACDANLVYVAVSHVPETDGSDATVVAVVIRGTDADAGDAWGVLKQAFEDLAVPLQSPLPWLADDPARVADGTLDALETIKGLRAGGQTLVEFLAVFLGASAGQSPVVVVTGHSLGGCLSTVVAPWLEAELGTAGMNVPMGLMTFAAPSAGNSDFAACIARQFPQSMRYFNSLDVVARAWDELDTINTIYDRCQIPLPDAVSWSRWGFREMLRWTGASYVQPSPRPMPLVGRCLALQPPADWYAEALHQHHTTTYMALLGGSSLPSAVKRRETVPPHRNQRRPTAPSLPAPAPGEERDGP